jgi:hypothetical protein
MSSAMVPVWIRHDFKCFDFRIDMLNHRTLLRKPFVICFFPFVQFVVPARFLRCHAVGVRRFYPRIPQASLYRYRFVNPFSDTVRIQPEIVDAPLLLPYIRYLPVLPVNGHLGFDGMPFLFPRIIRFFFGRGTGLSVTSATIRLISCGVPVRTFF